MWQLTCEVPGLNETVLPLLSHLLCDCAWLISGHQSYQVNVHETLQIKLIPSFLS